MLLSTFLQSLINLKQVIKLEFKRRLKKICIFVYLNIWMFFVDVGLTLLDEGTDLYCAFQYFM